MKMADDRTVNEPDILHSTRTVSSTSHNRENQPRPHVVPSSFSGFCLTNTMVTGDRETNQAGNRNCRGEPSAGHDESSQNGSRPASSDVRHLVNDQSQGQPAGIDNPALDAQPARIDDVNVREITARRESNEPLPDLVDSLHPPAYTQTRRNHHRDARHHRDSHHHRGGRHHRHSRQHRRSPSSPTTRLDDSEARRRCGGECCVECVTCITTFRWVLVLLAMMGVCCVVTGIILGALHMTIGDSFLTLSLMFIGLGVLLIVVVGVGWRCTPHGHEPCHLLFNLGVHAPGNDTRHHRSRHRHRRRHWHGGVHYPEFSHRRPPPSYSDSQQDYHNQLEAQARMEDPQGDDFSLPSSPPPTYRSRASTLRAGVAITFPPQPDSRPPTYRSHISNAPEHNRPRIRINSNGFHSEDAAVNENIVEQSEPQVSTINEVTSQPTNSQTSRESNPTNSERSRETNAANSQSSRESSNSQTARESNPTNSQTSRESNPTNSQTSRESNPTNSQTSTEGHSATSQISRPRNMTEQQVSADLSNPTSINEETGIPQPSSDNPTSLEANNPAADICEEDGSSVGATSPRSVLHAVRFFNQIESTGSSAPSSRHSSSASRSESRPITRERESSRTVKTQL